MNQFLSNLFHGTKLWLQRLFFLLLFLLVFYIALQNQEPMTLRLTADWQVTAPTIVVVIFAFLSGVAIGVPGVAIYHRLTKRAQRRKDAATAPQY